jgi:hypothetical protein
MKVRIEIACDNAAFADGDSGTEVARILRELAEVVEGEELERGRGSRLRDINGNTVGEMRVTR